MSSGHPAKERSDRSGAGESDPRSPRALSRKEFAALFVDCWPALRSIAAGVLGHPARADDVLQEAAVIALQKLDKFHRGTSFQAWIGQIVRFVALNTARRRQRSKSMPIDPGQFDHIAAGHHATPNGIVFRRDGSFAGEDQPFDDRLLAALNSLDETARVCLLLRTLHEMPYREISRLLNIPEGTAMSHVHRSRRALRQMLADRPGSSPSTENTA